MKNTKKIFKPFSQKIPIFGKAFCHFSKCLSSLVKMCIMNESKIVHIFN